jgi:hypothetical protein
LPYSADFTLCHYVPITKMKEPLRGTLYNTRKELIGAVGRSLLDINKSGRADSLRRLLQIWQKAVDMEDVYIKCVCLR